MKYTEAGCYLEVDVLTGNIDRVAVDPKVMEQNICRQGISINEPCGGFCRHSIETCLRVEESE